jgi:hypothetical protein
MGLRTVISEWNRGELYHRGTARNKEPLFQKVPREVVKDSHGNLAGL